MLVMFSSGNRPLAAPARVSIRMRHATALGSSWPKVNSMLSCAARWLGPCGDGIAHLLSLRRISETPPQPLSDQHGCLIAGISTFIASEPDERVPLLFRDVGGDPVHG